MVVIMTNRLIWEGGPNTIDTPMRHLQRLVEGRDPNQPAQYGTYLPNTVLGALRKNLTLGTYTLDSDVAINYDSMPRASAPAIAECDIKVTLNEVVHVPNRS